MGSTHRLHGKAVSTNNAAKMLGKQVLSLAATFQSWPAEILTIQWTCPCTDQEDVTSGKSHVYPPRLIASVIFTPDMYRSPNLAAHSAGWQQLHNDVASGVP